MNALSRKRKEWEYRNEKFLLEIVSFTTAVSIESIKKAGQLTSFLAYVIYKTLGIVLAIAFMMFVGPRLIREVSPERQPEDISPSLLELENRVKRSAFHK